MAVLPPSPFPLPNPCLQSLSKTITRAEEPTEEEKEPMGAPRKPHKQSQKRKSTTLGYLFKLEATGNGLPDSPPPSSETDEIVSMVSYCTYVFTFTDPSESPAQQDLKRLKLLHILSFLRSAKSPITDDRVLSPLVSMLSANLFRPLPPPAFPSTPSDTLEEALSSMTITPSWPHLHIIYDILASLIASAEPKTLRDRIDHPFLLSLLPLFGSEDPRERDRVKNVYHQLYSRLTADRAFMRRSMSHVFLRFVFEGGRHCGVGEMLEVWGSIINGFSVPLKEEHRMFLMRVLVPMHKPKAMPLYHRQLSYCVSQFVEKEPGLGEGVVKGILRCWPVTNCQKEVLLIGEMEDLVDIADQEQFHLLALPVCSQISRCLSSFNSQVAERALYAWNNERFVKMASQSMEEVFPIIVECIEKNIRWHWSKQVRQLTASVKKMLEEMDPGLYTKCLQDIEHREFMAGQEELKRKEKWEQLEMVCNKQMFSPEPAKLKRKEKWEQLEMVCNKQMFSPEPAKYAYVNH